jgi:hypothetical protein
LGRSIQPEVNETAPEVLSPGAAAGNCLLALTRQPLRRPGQPKAAAPDSCIRAASAPGERSCIHGKPMAETGQLYFRGHSAMRCRGPGDGARIPAGNGLLPLRHRPYRDLRCGCRVHAAGTQCRLPNRPLPDVLKPDIQCVRTHWIRGFIAFELTRRSRIVVLMVPMWSESGFREGVARLRGPGIGRRGRGWPGACCGWGWRGRRCGWGRSGTGIRD